ncbi:MAG: D-2-hydroxyacid dehydrogenase [Oscillospiraceae bacterium]|jgi:glycerate dehydrogenase|nr:D-2-hydroxyacid dehydrogenase [Oscillospiraceae bacterium]
MRIVILDGYTTNPGDLSWEGIAALGALTVYDHTPPPLTVERAHEAELVISNKTVLNAAVLAQLPRLRYIGLLSTGYDVVDLEAARERGVAVTNIPSYSRPSVAQMVFALLLELCSHVQAHSDCVHAGDWARSRDFCFWRFPLRELSGKTMGLIGFGQIGQSVAAVARAFGMQVLACRRTGGAGGGEPAPGLRLVSLEEVLRGADVLSLHCPLTPETRGLIRRETIAVMKPGALLINTARGPILNEADVAQALKEGRLGGAGLDVLSAEPPGEDNPLLHAPNCVITPHIAWATKEARGRLLAAAAENIAAFLRGERMNRVELR